MRILLIVFGSLLGAIVLAAIAAIVAIGFFVNTIVHGPNDSARSARIAAKIATFRLPRGYRYSIAIEAFTTTLVQIVPQNGRTRDFNIELQGITLPIIATSDEQFSKILENTVRSRCSALVADRDDRVTTASGTPLVTEFGRIPANVAFASIVALGTPERFDHAALRELLRSLK